MVDSTKRNPYIYYPETIGIKLKVSVFAASSNYRFEHKKSNHQTCDNLHFSHINFDNSDVEKSRRIDFNTRKGQIV